MLVLLLTDLGGAGDLAAPLETAGHVVTELVVGADGADDVGADALVLDLGAPIGPGWVLARRLAAGLPAVVVAPAGRLTGMLRSRARDVGADGPISPDDVVEWLATTCPTVPARIPVIPRPSSSTARAPVL